MDNLLNFVVTGNLNNLFDDLLDWDDLRDFDDPLNHLFNDLFDFNDLGDHSEDFEDIINIDDSHNFGVDHSDDGFIDFKDGSGSESELLEFFKKSFNEDSQMEFNFAGSAAGVSVDILDSDGLRDELDDLDEAVNGVDFEDVDDLLREVFGDAGVKFSEELGIFGAEVSELGHE